jgi:hypothetical protein
MKINCNLVVPAALCLALVTSVSARAAQIPVKTNNVMVLNFSLTAWPNATVAPEWVAAHQAAGADTGEASAAVPETSTGQPFSIVSSDLISSLNGVTNNGTAMHFSKKAQVLYWQVLSPRVLTTNSLGTNCQIIVRDGSAPHWVYTDISSFFTASDDYVSTRTAISGSETHKYSSLSFNSPGRLTLDLTALVVEEIGSTEVNDVALVRSLTWQAQGLGESTGSTPSQVISGTISTSKETLQ